MSTLPTTYRRFAELNPSVSRAYESLGEACAQAGPLDGKTAASTKSRFELLLSVKEHEMHHRAQLMLIQRLLGMVPHLTRQREKPR